MSALSLGQSTIGPCPIQLVVVMAVRKAVSAATMTFTAISAMRCLVIYRPPRLVPTVSGIGLVAITTLVAALVASGL